MPDVFRARHLFVERGAGLEEHGIGEDRDSSGGIEIGAASRQLQHIETHQADFGDVSGDSGDGDPIADFHSVSADDEEIGDHGEQDGLQADRQAGDDESGEGSEGAELGDQAEDHDQAAQETDDQPANDQ